MVSPRVSAQILKVLVEDNQTVVAGQILAEIDDSDYLVAKASEHANVEAAESELLNLAAGIERQSAVLTKLQRLFGRLRPHSALLKRMPSATKTCPQPGPEHSRSDKRLRLIWRAGGLQLIEILPLRSQRPKRYTS
ncbi:biotin/lipoyl-binding protein [Pseudomonas putida]|uniref:biotin/lipoyl-binding protein n=1 Tax=Pseudomonas putida TaxID=303 RepID=UPI003221EA45